MENPTFTIKIKLHDGQLLEMHSVSDEGREEFEGEFSEDADILRVTGALGVLVVRSNSIAWYQITPESE